MYLPTEMNLLADYLSRFPEVGVVGDGKRAVQPGDEPKEYCFAMTERQQVLEAMKRSREEAERRTDVYADETEDGRDDETLPEELPEEIERLATNATGLPPAPISNWRDTLAQATTADVELETIERCLDGDESDKESLTHDWRSMLDRGELERVNGEIHRTVGAHTMRLIPAALRSEVFDYFHCGPLGSHQCARATLDLMKGRVWWIGMNREVRHAVGCCELCQFVKSGTRRPALAPNPRGKSANSIVAMDLWGPIARAADGSRYVLTMVDTCTAYTRFVPLPNIKAAVAARAMLSDWIWPFGIMDAVRSDRGGQFRGDFNSSLLKSLGVRQMMTTAWNPPGNGICERQNQFLGVHVAQYAAERGGLSKTDWPAALHQIAAAYNCVRHGDNEKSPFELFLGRAPRLGIDIEWSAIATMAEQLPTDTVLNAEVRATLRATAKAALELGDPVADDEKNAIDERYAARMDYCAERPPELTDSEYHDFHAGDRVLLNITKLARSKSAKMGARWSGPFEVVNLVGDKAVRIRGADKKEATVGCARLKMHHVLEV